jgi:hypothetical protein
VTTEVRFITRRALVDAALAGSPSSHALRLLINALERRRDNIRRFVNWPALSDSLDRDAQALRAKLERQA